MQDVLLDAVEAAVDDPGRRPRPTSCRCWSSARRSGSALADLQRALRHPSRARCSASCRRSTCRPIASSTRRAISRPARASSGRDGPDRRASRRRSAPTSCSRPRTCRASCLGVEICEDMWIPVPPGRRGGARGRDRARQPVRLARSRSAGPRAARSSASRPRPRCLAAYHLRGRRARANRRPTSPGTARPPSTRTACCSPKASASRPASRSRSPMSISTSSARSAPAWARSTTTGASMRTARMRLPARDPFRLDPPRGDVGFERQVDASPSCRTTRPASRRIATRATTSRSRGSRSACAAIGHEARRDRRLGRARFDPRADRRRPRPSTGSAGRATDILAYTMPGFATSDETKAQRASRLMASLGVAAARTRHPAGRARRCSRRWATRSGGANRSTT